MNDTDRIAEIRARAENATEGPWDEVWRKIPGYTSYEVSDHGRVRSYLKVGRHKNRNAKYPRLMKLHQRGNRRLTVGLTMEDGSTQTRSVSRLVMLAFVGVCPEGLEVAHLNGDAADNRLSNLEYVTHQANEGHKKGHGTNPIGERNGLSRLLGWQAAEIKYLAEKSIPQARIADLFDVRPQVINDVLLEKRWTHVAARADVPFLLAELEQARTDVDNYRSYEEKYIGKLASMAAESHKLGDEVTRLSAELEHERGLSRRLATEGTVTATAIQRVRDVHTSSTWYRTPGHDRLWPSKEDAAYYNASDAAFTAANVETVTICGECSGEDDWPSTVSTDEVTAVSWPCPTIAALAGEVPDAD